MIDQWVSAVTKITAVKSVADLPKWVIGAGVVASLIYVANNAPARAAIADAGEAALRPVRRAKRFAMGRAGRDF